jgi:hypothetical protein
VLFPKIPIVFVLIKELDPTLIEFIVTEVLTEEFPTFKALVEMLNIEEELLIDNCVELCNEFTVELPIKTLEELTVTLDPTNKPEVF